MQELLARQKIKPLCPYFGVCGGCAYQDFTYEDELSVKEEKLRKLFLGELPLSEDKIESIIPSPSPYFYRSRLDLSLRRSRGTIQMGFMSEGTRKLVSIDACSIARPEINAFLPTLKKLASERLPENYRSANLVVKTGDDGKIRWGGIGRKSLQLPEEDYFWTEILGKRIYYPLDTFFQINLGILPRLMEKLEELLDLTSETHLLDLYAGVGLFWVMFASKVKGIWAVEENANAVRVAERNRQYHHFSNVSLKATRTEDYLEEILKELEGKPLAALVDPPRKGLSPSALEKLIGVKELKPLLYISCHPASLIRDLREFLKAGWRIERIIPFDFFPRTQHLEVVVKLVGEVR